MEEFEKKIAEGGFVEHAKFGGNRYGTSKAMIEEFMGQGRIVVLDIEMEVRDIAPFALLLRSIEKLGAKSFGLGWIATNM
jgi:guanylate kinase